MAHDFSEILRKLGILLVLRSDGRVSLLNKQDLKETVASSRESAENFWKHVATAKDFERRKRLMASVLAMLAQLAAARK
jgi:neutral trehalase